MNTKHCCVLIPYYEDGDKLIGTLRSLLPLPDGVDILVVDDGSERRPAADVVASDRQLSRLIQLSVDKLPHNCGIEHALNFGLNQIVDRYPFVARLDCGDTALPGRLERQQDYLMENPDCVLVGSWVEFVDPAGKHLYMVKQPQGDRAARRAMHVNAAFTHPAVMFRSEAVRMAGLYPVNRQAAEDFAFFWKLLEFGEGHNIPDVLTRCEINPNGISNTRRRVQLRTRLRILGEHYDGSAVASYGIVRSAVQLATPRSASVFLRRAAGVMQSRLSGHPGH